MPAQGFPRPVENPWESIRGSPDPPDRIPVVTPNWCDPKPTITDSWNLIPTTLDPRDLDIGDIRHVGLDTGKFRIVRLCTDCLEF